jgi:hypothetical protein
MGIIHAPTEFRLLFSAKQDSDLFNIYYSVGLLGDIIDVDRTMGLLLVVHSVARSPYIQNRTLISVIADRIMSKPLVILLPRYLEWKSFDLSGIPH